MKRHRIPFFIWIFRGLFFVWLGGLSAWAQAPAAAGAGPAVPPPIPDRELPEVLTRGPVHEAFAEPVNLQVQADVVAPHPPPDAIEETPPSDRPEGDQFEWVPGYWAWDADRDSFIWVSACWRATPPGLHWVPGYWNPVERGWQWVSGFWAPNDLQDIDYLPDPPELGTAQPPGPPPTEDSIWVAPCWYWVDGRYVMRAGYWLMAQPDWMWVPSGYVRTPRGCVFAEGHWDYALERRGVLFAPVYFPRPVYARPGFVFTPGVVVNLGALTFSLFAYPRYGHYYFGDYYDDFYLNIGIFPWFECRRNYAWYDPVYEHDRWRHRHDRDNWESGERQEYEKCRADRTFRPAKTMREFEARFKETDTPTRKNYAVVRPLKKAVERKDNSVRFVPVDDNARHRAVRQEVSVRKFREERKRWETTPGATPTVQPLPIPVEPAERTGHRTLKRDTEPAIVTPVKRPPVTVPEGQPDRGNGIVIKSKTTELPPEPAPAEPTPSVTVPSSRHNRGPDTPAPAKPDTAEPVKTVKKATPLPSPPAIVPSSHHDRKTDSGEKVMTVTPPSMPEPSPSSKRFGRGVILDRVTIPPQLDQDIPGVNSKPVKGLPSPPAAEGKRRGKIKNSDKAVDMEEAD